MALDSSDSSKVQITFESSYSGGGKRTKDYDLLIVACDPRALAPVLNYSSDELAVFNKFQNCHIHTTCVTIKRSVPVDYGVIFSPPKNEAMDGDIYAFRNETAKQFGKDAANKLDNNVFTIYQLAGAKSAVKTAKDFATIFEKQVDNLDWFKHGGIVERHGEPMTTPYFDHFDKSEIKAGLPWDYLKLQGKHNTLFVHASTCFESAFHCWGYARDLMTQYQPSMDALPTDKQNAKIAIIGAGVSGILAANRLQQLGYNMKNVDLLEKTGRFGGKTHTRDVDGPTPPGKQDEKTVCELGTCYLSPAYKHMVHNLYQYLIDNEPAGFGTKDGVFRGIDVRGSLVPVPADGPVMSYPEYVIKEASYILDKWEWVTEDVLGEELVIYIYEHFKCMGGKSPMPLEPPQYFLDNYGDSSFGDFLKANGIEALKPILQYAYEVQGYGSVEEVPAYYGLLWVTPPTIWGIIVDSVEGIVKYVGPPVVTAFPKGWGDLWQEIVKQDKLNIELGVTIDSITRG